MYSKIWLWNFCVVSEAGGWFMLTDSFSDLTLATVPPVSRVERCTETRHSKMYIKSNHLD